MWDIQPDFLAKMRDYLALPLVTFDHAGLAFLGLVLLKLGTDKYLARNFQLTNLRHDPQMNSLEYSPFYHLSIVVLVLAQVNWNMFDLVIWTYFYVGVGILRKAVLSVKLEKEAMLSGYAFDLKLVRLLESAKVAGGWLFLGSVFLFIKAEMWFAGASMKVLNLLIFPVIMLAIDSAFIFLSSLASQKDILCYYNQNINEIQPAYKLELVEKVLASAFKVWHFYNIIRIFLRAMLDRMGVLDYMWIFSILNAGFSALKILVSSISKYRSYSKLMKKFDRLFRRSTSAPDQICTICLCELLNCRQLASCGHLFHYRCMFQWMQTKLECPVCRVPIQLS